MQDEAPTLDQTFDFLLENLRREFSKMYGVRDEAFVRQTARNQFDDDRCLDNRWMVIERRRGTRPVRVLDMAAGCGTFVLYGLRHGHDVWGVEPEGWKREYFRRKVLASGYPREYLDRLVEGVGEKLAYPDNSFDVVSSYQTLEHVQDVSACVREMLRVVRPGGAVYVRAPDYRTFFEPHYRLPMLPRMNRRLARWYLRTLGRPTAGLETLNWITEDEVVRLAESSDVPVRVERMTDVYAQERRERIRRRLPEPLRVATVTDLAVGVATARSALRSAARVGRAVTDMDLWITKQARG